MVATEAKGGDFGGREDLFDDICSLEVEDPTKSCAPPRLCTHLRYGYKGHPPVGWRNSSGMGLRITNIPSTYHSYRLISRGANGASRKVAQIAIFPCRWARCEGLRRLREKSSLKQIVRNFQQTFRQVLRRVEDR